MATREPVRETLPGPAYHSEEIYQVDRERVFFRNWMCVGRAERLPRPGSWIRVEIAGESILVVRGKDDQVRGVLQRLPPPRLAAVRRRAGTDPQHAALPVPRVELRPRRVAAQHPDDRGRRDRPGEHRALAGPRRRVGGLRLRQPLPRGAPAAARAPRRPAGRRARAWPGWGSATCGPRRLDGQRGRGQLEDRAGELQRVPALPDGPPGADRRWSRPTARAASSRRAGRTAASHWPTVVRRSRWTRACACPCSPG